MFDMCCAPCSPAYGMTYHNGYDFEGYFQGVHAGKDSQSNFRGAGAVPKGLPKDVLAEPQPHNTPDHQPLPAHMAGRS
jgi:hypothetical protein